MSRTLIPPTLPPPKNKFPCDNPFLTNKYLPDTYFPTMKRPVWFRPHNPEIDNRTVLPNKRRRVCPSPLEHRNLVELKKLERDNEKFLKSGTCPSHGGLITLPVKVMKYVNHQEGSINRLLQGQAELLEEVSQFSKMLRETIERFEMTNAKVKNQAQAAKKPTVVWTSAQFRTFQTYLTFIVQMLNNFKGMRMENGRNLSLNNSALQFNSPISLAVNLPNPVVLSTFECVKQLRTLIHFQCNFDCDEEMASLIGSQRPPTYDAVLQCLVRIEKNMKEFMKRVIIKDHGSSGEHPSVLALNTTMAISPYQSLPALDTTPHPTHFSTPVKKRNADSSVIEMENEWKLQGRVPFVKNIFDVPPATEVSKRVKKTPKRVSFVGVPVDNSMEVD